MGETQTLPAYDHGGGRTWEHGLGLGEQHPLDGQRRTRRMAWWSPYALLTVMAYLAAMPLWTHENYGRPLLVAGLGLTAYQVAL